MWVYLALTSLATMYFGWHYIVDDIAGLVIGFTSVYLGGLLTGWRIERRSTRRRCSWTAHGRERDRPARGRCLMRPTPGIWTRCRSTPPTCSR